MECARCSQAFSPGQATARTARGAVCLSCTSREWPAEAVDWQLVPDERSKGTAGPSCAACGFLAWGEFEGVPVHYRHARLGTHHCGACHRPGRDWQRHGDSAQGV